MIILFHHPCNYWKMKMLGGGWIKFKKNRNLSASLNRSLFANIPKIKHESRFVVPHFSFMSLLHVFILINYLKEENSRSSTHLLLHTNRRNRSKGWSAPPQRLWRSCQRIPRNRTSISSWWGRGLCRVPGRTGSGWWWSRLHPSCWSWRAAAGWPLTPGRWRTSTGSGPERR